MVHESFIDSEPVSKPEIAAKSVIPLVPTPPSSVPTKNLKVEPPSTETDSNKKYYVKFSFMITYILLLTTATLTFIEAMRTDKPFIRHVLNLETCISIVAGYFYSVFLGQLENAEKKGQDQSELWGDISKTRYVDWSITTPLMLLALCVVLSNNSNTVIRLPVFLAIAALNYLMLFIGFLGEFNFLPMISATLLGFVPFLFMFYVIYINFVAPKYNFANSVLYGIYAIVWGLYGLAYMMDSYAKNISYNILDSIAKCLIGNALFIYYANIIKL
jgi:bacteriorhodopsin